MTTLNGTIIRFVSSNDSGIFLTIFEDGVQTHQFAQSARYIDFIAPATIHVVDLGYFYVPNCTHVVVVGAVDILTNISINVSDGCKFDECMVENLSECNIYKSPNNTCWTFKPPNPIFKHTMGMDVKDIEISGNSGSRIVRYKAPNGSCQTMPLAGTTLHFRQYGNIIILSTYVGCEGINILVGTMNIPSVQIKNRSTAMINVNMSALNPGSYIVIGANNVYNVNFKKLLT